MTRLIFLRHGEALGAEGRCIGQTDIPLSPEGAAAIHRLAVEGLESLVAPFHDRVRVVSSDLRRAEESAGIVAAAIGCGIERDARLRELSFGEWEGRLWSEIERNDPERLRSWMGRWSETAAPGGESVSDLLKRARSWLGDAVSGGMVERAIVVVSHAGWLRAAVSHLLECDIARMFDIPAEHARATVIDVNAGRAILIASNVAARAANQAPEEQTSAEQRVPNLQRR